MRLKSTRSEVYELVSEPVEVFDSIFLEFLEA